MKTGTLQELNVQPGDVVECWNAAHKGTRFTVDDDWQEWSASKKPWWRIISRAPRDDTPKLWRDMSAEEKGALLLAAHEGKVIEQHQGPFGWQERVDMPMWQGHSAYRAKPDDVRETVEMQWAYEKGGKDGYAHPVNKSATHRITFDTINGEPDPASIRMEKL